MVFRWKTPTGSRVNYMSYMPLGTCPRDSFHSESSEKKEVYLKSMEIYNIPL